MLYSIAAPLSLDNVCLFFVPIVRRLLGNGLRNLAHIQVLLILVFFSLTLSAWKAWHSDLGMVCI